MEGSSDLPSRATILTAILVVLICGIGIIWRRGEKKRYPPIAGTAIHQLLNFRRLHDYHTDLSHRYKTFRVLVPVGNQILTTDPANVEHILRTNFNNYGKGKLNYRNMKELFGDGIFAVDGDKWRHQRKLASHEFTTKVLRDFSSITFQRNASKLAKIIYEGANSGRVMDIQELLMKSTMDSIFKVGFGMELNSLDGSEEGSRFTREFDNASEFVAKRYMDIFWKIRRFLNIGSEAELKKSIKVINDFVYKLIHTKIEQMSQGANDLVKKEDILSRFLLERENDPKKMTEEYLRDIILNFLIAGKDTTAGALSWFIYMICKHPLVQDKIAEEVIGAIKDITNKSIGEFSNSLTPEALDQMHYLHAALSETLRLYPSVPMDNKVCFSDDELPDGFNVRKGDVVFYQPYAMGRMKYLWGDDAETFRPERWMDDNGIYRPESPFKFTAFQAGPRICLGKDFAYRQMKIFAAVLLQFFKFKLSNESSVINYRTMITLNIDGGLHVQASHR